MYTHPLHTGRGGWTWYTGSAAWMYRLGVESLLGLKRRGGALLVDPCLPRGWPGFKATVRHGGSTYTITVENPDGVNRGVVRVELDGEQQANGSVPLAADGATHQVRVVMGTA